MIPITVVTNGDGPTALLTGGNHGDEYEGPVALFDRARSVKPDAVRGRIIIVPAMNYRHASCTLIEVDPIDRTNRAARFGPRVSRSAHAPAAREVASGNAMRSDRAASERTRP
jgi:N-alpha-acetyl-L-2,4-diaminobutyrate deacetylase